MNHIDNSNTLSNLHKLADTCLYDFCPPADKLHTHGFLGAGGDLTVSTLLHAYRSGAFPWFDEDEPICWWSPEVRCVIAPSDFYPSKSLIRTAKKQPWTITTNADFEAVINACRAPRRDTVQTWIHDSMVLAYRQLFKIGAAASIEVWAGMPYDSELIGGLYGVSFGSIFCGESMFHRRSDASKIAFWALVHWAKQYGIQLIDCQLENPHLRRLGANLMPRDEFLELLKHLVMTPCLGISGASVQIPCIDLVNSPK